MKRRTFKAVVMRGWSDLVGERQTFAWNSAIRATESIVREYAREVKSGGFTGEHPDSTGKPATPGAVYRRTWTDRYGDELRALVWEVDNS